MRKHWSTVQWFFSLFLGRPGFKIYKAKIQISSFSISSEFSKICSPYLNFNQNILIDSLAMYDESTGRGVVSCSRALEGQDRWLLNLWSTDRFSTISETTPPHYFSSYLPGKSVLRLMIRSRIQCWKLTSPNASLSQVAVIYLHSVLFLGKVLNLN